MSAPGQHRFFGRVRLSSGRDEIGAARRRQSATLMAATSIVGALVLAGGLALARGGGNPVAPVADTTAHYDAPDAPAAVNAPTGHKRKETRANGLAVCVRLCDGFFFPSAASSGGDEACALQCPDAPTALYTERAGSDSIDDAVSTNGAPYSALPVAYRYRTTFDSTCTCHHPSLSGYSASVLTDPTLRKGDLVMTPKGFLVFEGAKAHSATSLDFVALSQASSLPKELRAALAAMERVGASIRQAGAGPSLSASGGQGRASTPPTPVISTR
jgi:hypothetical protein